MVAQEENDLHMKSSEVCIKTRSPPASLPIQGQVTKHTTVKWPIVGNITIEMLFALTRGTQEPIYTKHSWVACQRAEKPGLDECIPRLFYGLLNAYLYEQRPNLHICISQFTRYNLSTDFFSCWRSAGSVKIDLIKKKM